MPEQVPTYPDYAGEFLVVDESHHNWAAETGDVRYFARTILNGREAHVMIPYSGTPTPEHMDILVHDAFNDLRQTEAVK